MKWIFLFVVTLSSTALFAQKDKPSGGAKPGLSTDIYEKEKTEKTISGTVKLVREIQGNWEVAFNGHPGFYIIPDGSDAQALLVEAQKKQQSVIVRVDEVSQRVLSAQWGAAGKGK